MSSAFLALFTGSFLTPWWSLIGLIVVWDNLERMSAFELFIRVNYLLGIWCGLRAFLNEHKSRKAKIVGAIAFAAILIIILSILYLPKVAYC